MKSYKNMTEFRRVLQREIAWGDCFNIGKTTYYIYEYGERYGGKDYVCFYSKQANKMLTIEYDAPSSQYINGERIQTKTYYFYSLEIEGDPFLWREDTVIA